MGLLWLPIVAALLITTMALFIVAVSEYAKKHRHHCLEPSQLRNKCNDLS